MTTYLPDSYYLAYTLSSNRVAIPASVENRRFDNGSQLGMLRIGR